MSKLPEFYCLGAKILGPCFYDLSNPSLTFFSIGQLATVVALIFTFSQLAKPIVKFRIATRYSPSWVPWVGIAIAIICVFWAGMLRALPQRGAPVVGYPIFWEFVAGVCLVWAGLLMISRVTRKARLSKRNAGKYLNESRSLIARGNMDDLREYGDEIEGSISTAIATCKRYETRLLVASTKTAKKKKPATDFERVCFTLLDLWADKQFCQILVTRCPQTATRILLEVQDKRLYETGAYALVQELIGRAISHPDSILHREGDYSGLGRDKAFMSMAFGNTDFVTSRLRPLQAWQTYEQDRISVSQVERYGEAIDIALRAAIEERRTDSIFAALSSALHVVNNIARRAAWAMTRIPEGELSQSDWSKVLTLCGDIHGKGIETIASLPVEQQPSAQAAQIDPITYKSDFSIYDALAKNAFEYVQCLAICKEHDDLTRLDAIFLWEKLFPRHTSSTPHALEAVRLRFLFALREQIDKNLDTEHWFYPVVTRVLVAMWGIPECPGDVQPLDGGYSKDESELFVYVYQLMRQNFVAIRHKNLEYANDLLPQKVDYVEQPPSLRQTWFRGRTTALGLIIPPD